MKLVCNKCLNFTESIAIRIKRDEDKVDLVKIFQFYKSYNSIILDRLK